MIKYIFTIFIIGSFYTSIAQDNIELLAQRTCECLKTKNFSKKTKDEIQMELGLCMIGEAQKLKIPIDLKNESSMEKFGEKVGVKMAAICPESFAKFLNSETKEGTTLMDEYANEDKTLIKIEGTITKFTKDELAYLFVNTTEGREVKLMVLKYFPGAEKLIEGSKEYLNKNVSIEYQESEYFLPRIGEFVKLKEVTSMKVITK